MMTGVVTEEREERERREARREVRKRERERLLFIFESVAEFSLKKTGVALRLAVW